MSSSSQPTAACNSSNNNNNGSLHMQENTLAWKQNIPLGMRFRPTHEELILYFLTNKALNQPFFDGIINELDVYNYEPHQLRGFGVEHDGCMYFFTRVEHKDSSESRIRRVLYNNKGFWRATQSRKFYGGAIGSKQPLCYHRYTNETGPNLKSLYQKQNWLMNEYRLNGKFTIGADGKELVLCAIYYNQNKRRDAEQQEDG